MTQNNEDFIRYSCPQCAAALKSSASMAGTESLCPRCHASCRVPSVPKVEEPIGVYALAGETVTRPKDGPEPLLRVYCHVCRTMMYARRCDVGQKLICPDCGKTTVVEPQEPSLSHLGPPSEEIGEYALANEFDPTTGQTPETEQNFVNFDCRVCHTRLNASLDQVGMPMKCPDCGTENIVPKPSRELGAAHASLTQNAREKWVEPPPLVHHYQPGRDYRDPEVVAEYEARRAAKERRLYIAATRFPPFSVFFSRTFTFPWRPASLAQTIIAVILFFLALLVVQIGVFVMPSDGVVGIGAVGFAALGGILVTLFGLTLFVAWFITMSVYGLAVLRETSYGNRDIQNWPLPWSIETMGEPIFCFAAILYSFAPAVLAASLWNRLGWSHSTTLLVTLPLLFPIVLLSMLESNSCFIPITKPVLSSVVRSWKAWFVFYLITEAMLGGVLGFFVMASRWASLFQVLSLALLGPWVCLSYFRLLGRLASFCAGNEK